MSLRFVSISSPRIGTIIKGRGLRERTRYFPNAALSKETPLTLHLGESTIEVPFSVDEARNLGRSFNGLLQTFKDKQEAEAPKKFDIMTYKFEEEAPKDDSLDSLEVMCNPNAFPSAFEAKLLVSLKARNGIKISGESHLSQMKSDLQIFLRNNVVDKN
eukprot:g3197.t1